MRNLQKAWSDEATSSHLLMFRIERQEKNKNKGYWKDNFGFEKTSTKKIGQKY